MTKSSTPCRRAFRFGRSAGAPQNGQAVVLLVVPSRLAYLVRLPGFLSGSVTATTRLRDQPDDPLDRVWVLDCDRHLGRFAISPEQLALSRGERPVDLAGGHAAAPLFLRLVYFAASASSVNNSDSGALSTAGSRS